MAPVESEFLTVEEVSQYLRIPLSTVYKLATNKTLPAFQVGKHWRFRREALQEWIKQQEKEQDQEKKSS